MSIKRMQPVSALDISTVPNLRDMGGYKTREGAAVANGLVYRTDTSTR